MNKQQARQIIKDTFENPFDKQRFTKFLLDFLNHFEEDTFLHRGYNIPDSYNEYISSWQRLGIYSDGESRIDLLIVNLKIETSLEQARSRQRNFIAGYLQGKYGRSSEKEAALVAYVSPDKKDWRFSLVKMDYKFEKTKTGKVRVKEELTPARRWSFLVGENEGSHTAQSRLVDILANDEQAPTLIKIENAFDIETVTKEFFLKYRELFMRTKEELDRVVNNDPKIKADFDDKGVDTVNFTKKLLGQIVFLYFLQKKGWFGVARGYDWGAGSKQFLRELFQKKHTNYNNFFNDILEPLFYEALRRDRSDDDGYYKLFDCKIPFLNGGLFDPIGENGGYDWVSTEILLPDDLFSNKNKTKEGDTGNGILDIFDRYNFTVREDEPLEKEVAIDPELLGKAYEKFNAIRPDNYVEFKKALKSGRKGEENKFNKKFGVYYTPREIVHYMCQQSLINYLYTQINNSAISYQNIGDSQTDMLGDKAKKDQLNLTVEHRPTPKISKADIETLIHTGEHISENEAWVTATGKETKTYSYKMPESIRNHAPLIDAKLAEITVCDPAVGSGAFPVGMMNVIVKIRNALSKYIQDKTRTIYEFKRRCIEHSLYGVDIDPGAVEIAKLRLWLSLVVDEEDIKNIKPLPNLDYKIVRGNSLIGFPEDWESPIAKEIEKLKDDYFNETNPAKKIDLKNTIDEKLNKRYKNSVRTFGHKIDFDFRMVFSEVFHEKTSPERSRRGGFDVLIANPPYVYNRNLPLKERTILQNKFKSADDLYIYFIYQSIRQLKTSGTLSFITPNTYFSLSTRSEFRNFILKFNNLLFTYSGFCFSDAYVETMILFLTNEKTKSGNLMGFIPKPNDYKSYDVLFANNRVFQDNSYFRFFWPTKINLEINRRINHPLYKQSLRFHDALNGRVKNVQERADYINNLKMGDLTLLGIISNGEQGLVTGNNSKYIGRISRSRVLDDKIERNFLDKLNENSNAAVEYKDFVNNRVHYYNLAERIKQKTKKPDYFGKFFLYKIISSRMIKSFSDLTDREKRVGGAVDLWVFYNRGNPEGFKWFVPYTGSINWSQKFVKELKEGKKTNSRWQGEVYFDKTGFAWVDYFTNKLKAFFVEEGIYSKNVVKLHSISSLISNKYITAILNSKFASYYVKQFITSTHTLQINDGRLIPIKVPDVDYQSNIESIVDKILNIIKDDNYLHNMTKQAKVKALEAKIDQLVYKLYDLTPEEIKIVEGDKSK